MGSQTEMEPEPIVYPADEWVAFTSVLCKTWLDLLAHAKVQGGIVVSRACEDGS